MEGQKSNKEELGKTDKQLNAIFGVSLRWIHNIDFFRGELRV